MITMGIILIAALLALALNLFYQAGYLKGSVVLNNKLYKENQNYEIKLRLMTEKWNALMLKKNNLVMKVNDLENSLYKISSIENLTRPGLLNEVRERKVTDYASWWNNINQKNFEIVAKRIDNMMTESLIRTRSN